MIKMNLNCVKLRAVCFTRGARQQFLQDYQVLMIKMFRLE